MINTPETPEVHVSTIAGAKEAEKQFLREETEESLKSLRQEIDVA